MKLGLGRIGRIGLIGLMVVAGCSSGGGGEDGEPASPASTPVGSPSRPHSAEPEPSTGEDHSHHLALDEIQRILDEARFDEDDLALAVSETYLRESGLDTPTLAYCGDEADPADEYRLARTQRWWLNDAWPSRGDGGYTVGAEIVLYEDGRVPEVLAAFRAVPDTCPDAGFASGSAVTFGHAEVPDGLPEGSAALRDEWTYADGARAAGFVIAIPAGDVIGFLYIRGDDDAVQSRVAALARDLADRVSGASEQLATSRDGG